MPRVAMKMKVRLMPPKLASTPDAVATSRLRTPLRLVWIV